ncbi:probable pectinesterase/pectinesterase inhibitor 46 [Henckelia pumila]|uniref:probable pectinesterase/pectinesterase inhibitor 46 n=1 Tax=Henckelia pumila TaxID=405737 RepID=UPI003C6E2966
MGFINAAKVKKQVVALLSTSDQSVFYRCRIESHQDTLYAHSGRQFYRDCLIYGTVDFIFGDSAVVIQNSRIVPYRPIEGNTNTITAQGKVCPCSNTGISIQNCVISSPEWDLTGGWLPWDQYVPVNINYIEFNNRGPGANVAGRVQWKGVSARNSTREQASRFTVRSLINGDRWLPAIGVPFQLDL